MMPVMKMARLPLNIAKTSIAAAQHFISEMAAAVIFGWCADEAPSVHPQVFFS